MGDPVHYIALELDIELLTLFFIIEDFVVAAKTCSANINKFEIIHPQAKMAMNKFCYEIFDL